MITLNLIPTGDKQELRLLRIFLAVKNIISLSLVGIITIATGLIFAKVFLQNYFTHIAASSMKTSVSSTLFSTNEIQSLQQEINTIKKIQADYIPWSQVLLELSARIKDGITLSDLRISADGQTEISGIARTREDLLRLHDLLVSSGMADDFEIPLALKLQQASIKFHFSIKINIPGLPEAR